MALAEPTVMPTVQPPGGRSLASVGRFRRLRLVNAPYLRRHVLNARLLKLTRSWFNHESSFGFNVAPMSVRPQVTMNREGSAWKSV